MAGKNGGRNYYLTFPFDLPSLPSVRKMRRSKFGARGVLAYYELRSAVAQALAYDQVVEIDDAVAMSCDWEMSEEDAVECLDFMASCGLVDAASLEHGFVGISEISRWKEQSDKKSSAGVASGKSRRERSFE